MDGHPLSSETPSPLQALDSDDSSKRDATPGFLEPGSKFGGYQVGACIGEGGMARVYQAEHAGLRRQVALKVLTDGFAKHPDARERFLREARIAAAIKHPNVVNVFDVGVHDEVPYLVMELLDGQDLEKLLASKGCLDEALLVDIMVPVVAGLIGVHEAGIVHRDLKPGNIFLVRGKYNETEPKLLDFGISKALGLDQLRLTANRGFMGTPFYASPEGLQSGEVTALSDQYSLGVVMYECATGVTPFAASTFPELFKLITAGNYTPPGVHKPELSRRLTRIIERAMSRDPEARFKDLREMGRELLLMSGQRTRITWGLSFGELPRTEGANGGQASNAAVRASSNRPGSRLPPKRRKRALVALLAAVPLLLICIGVFAWSWRRHPVVDSSGKASVAAASPAAPPLPGAAHPEGRPEGESQRPALAEAVASGAVARVVLADSDLKGGGPEPHRQVLGAQVLGSQVLGAQVLGATAVTEKRSATARAAPPAASPVPEQVSARRFPHATASSGRPAANGARESDPEWALPPVRSESQDFPVGANRAPIFD